MWKASEHSKTSGRTFTIEGKEWSGPITCIACHNPHNSENPHQLVADPENLCTSCHFQGAVLKGKGAEGVEETRSLHTAITCIECHMTESNHLMRVLRPDDPDLAEDRTDSCSACHKVHLDYPVNHYRWIRGFDDYDNWQGSGVSGNSARSFYYPPKPMNCQDCHMPMVPSQDAGNINGFVHEHNFAAANAAVPTSHGDTQQVADVEKFLKGAVTVDVFAIAEEPKGEAERVNASALLGSAPQAATMFAVGEESARGQEASMVSAVPPAKIMAPLNRVNAVLHRGETARVEVVVCQPRATE
jgi:predicted CXXCH cytochrome family protein